MTWAGKNNRSDRSEAADLDEALAAELALGVIDEAERASLEARAARDPAFRRRVGAWRDRFAAFESDAEPTPPPQWIKVGLDRMLDAEMGGATRKRQPLLQRLWASAPFWRSTAAAAGVAYASTFFLAAAPTPPGTPKAPAPAPIAARADGVFVASFDPAADGRKVLVIFSPKRGTFHAISLPGAAAKAPVAVAKSQSVEIGASRGSSNIAAAPAATAPPARRAAPPAHRAAPPAHRAAPPGSDRPNGDNQMRLYLVDDRGAQTDLGVVQPTVVAKPSFDREVWARMSGPNARFAITVGRSQDKIYAFGSPLQ
ncbi:MAG: hypothetical protein MRY74_03485 [Neomegalonema sp.]|nr:hypothetical protein [Neomegalonema sp.]